MRRAACQLERLHDIEQADSLEVTETCERKGTCSQHFVVSLYRSARLTRYSPQMRRVAKPSSLPLLLVPHARNVSSDEPPRPSLRAFRHKSRILGSSGARGTRWCAWTAVRRRRGEGVVQRGRGRGGARGGCVDFGGFGENGARRLAEHAGTAEGVDAGHAAHAVVRDGGVESVSSCTGRERRVGRVEESRRVDR